MLALPLYAATAAAVIALTHVCMTRLSRGAAIALVLIPLCFTGRALLTGRVYGPIDLPYESEPLRAMRAQYGLDARAYNVALSDVSSQMIPWRAAEKRVLAEGAWPLWNRFMFGGGPLAASAQPAAYIPVTLLACLLPVGDGTTYVATMWFLIAAVCAFVFARELGCRESVAIFAAAAWAFSTSIAFFILFPVGQAWTLAPLVLTAVKRRATILLTVALVLVILAGHPESVLEIVFIGALYGIALKPGLRALAYAFAAGVLALLLTAIYLLPLIEALPQTGEYMVRHAQPQTGASPRDALAQLGADFFPWLQFRMGAIAPVSTCVGSLVLILAVWGAVRLRAYFFVALAILGLVAGTNYVGVVRVWRVLPLFDVANNNTLVFGAALAMVMLSALALERAEWRSIAIFIGVGTVVIAIASIAIQRGVVMQPWHERWGNYKMFGEIAVPALVALALLWRGQKHAIAIVIVALLAQRVIEEGFVYPVLPRDAAYPPIPLLSHIDRSGPPFRITGQHFALIPGASAAYGLEDVRGYTAMTFLPYYRTYPLWSTYQPGWFNRVDDLDKPFLSFLNVRYAITSSNERDHEGWREVARDRGSKLLENTRVLERAFIPNTSTGAGSLSVQRTKYGLRIDAVMHRAGSIFISEQAWRGWRAYIDGRRVKMFPANLAFLGVYVPEGRHMIEVKYWPESFVIGRAISALTLLGLIAWGIWRPRQDSNLRPTA